MNPSGLLQSPHQFTYGDSTASQPHFASGLGGILERLLPAAGSVLGAVGGTFLAPGAGTAAGGAGGSVLGQKLEDILTGSHTSAGGYLGQAALGSLGGIGAGAGALRGGVNALRAGEDLGAAGSALRFGTRGAAAVGAEQPAGIIDKSLLASNVNAGKSFLPTAIGKGATRAGQQAMLAPMSGLSKGTAAGLLRNTGDLRSLGYNSVSQAAEHAPFVTGPDGALTVARQSMLHSPAARQIDASGFPGMVKETLSNNMSLADTAKLNKIEQKILGSQSAGGTTRLRNTMASSDGTTGSIFDKYGLQGGEQGIGIVSPEQFNGALKEVGALKADPGSAEKAAINEIYGKMKGALNESLSSVPVTPELKAGIVSQLKLSGISNPRLLRAVNNAQSWSDLSGIESRFVSASQAAGETTAAQLRGGIPGLSQSPKPTLTGIANQAGGRLAERGISSGAGLIESLLGRTPQEITSGGQLASQTAKKVGFQQLLGRGLTGMGANKQAPQPSDLTTPGSTSLTGGLTGAGLGTPTDQTQQTPFSPENIQKALIADLALNRGKNVTQLLGIYNAFGSPKAQSLPAASQTRHDNINSALSALDAAESNLVTAGGAKGAAVGQLAKLPLFGQYLNNAGVAYEKTKMDAATQLAKAVTGNSRAPANIVEGFLKSLPDITDTQQQASTKLSMLRNQIMRQAQEFGFSDITQGAGQ